MKITEFKTSSPFGLPELLSEIEISPELKAYQDDMPSDESIELVKESINVNGYDQTKPIECYQDPKTGRFYVLRGWTRYTACKELGLETIPVITLDVPKDKREDFVIQDNTARRQMTAKQKKVIAGKVLKNSPQKSDRQIGAITGLDHKTIGTLRSGMGSTGEIPQLGKTIGKDGKERTTKPKPKAKPESTGEIPQLGKQAFKKEYESMSQAQRKKAVDQLIGEFIENRTARQKLMDKVAILDDRAKEITQGLEAIGQTQELHRALKTRDNWKEYLKPESKK